MKNTAKGKPLRLFYRGFVDHDHVDTDAGEDQIGLEIIKSFYSKICPNCKSIFTGYSTTPNEENLKGTPIDQAVILFTHKVLFCPYCGWWQLRSEGTVFKNEVKWGNVQYAHQYHSLLEEVDISSNDIMLNDLKVHLIRRWNDRKFISASKAEQLVADIMKEHLKCSVYHATANVNSPDGGIDLFVCTDDGRVKAAVQVKRRETREVELVNEVRNFIGALVINGHDKGIFVTTASRFSSGAKAIQANTNLRRHKLELKLIDGERLLDILKATTPRQEIKLPSIINNDMQWKGPDGSTLTTGELLWNGK